MAAASSAPVAPISTSLRHVKKTVRDATEDGGKMFLSSLFVLAVMVVDCLFFLCNHATASAWELNPVALFLLGFGPLVPVLFRMFSTFFAVYIVQLAGPQLQAAAMGVLSGAHAYLAVLYLIILI